MAHKGFPIPSTPQVTGVQARKLLGHTEKMQYIHLLLVTPDRDYPFLLSGEMTIEVAAALRQALESEGIRPQS